MQSGSLSRDTGALSEQSRFQLEEKAHEPGFPLPLSLQVSLLEVVSIPKELPCSFAAGGLLLWV